MSVLGYTVWVGGTEVTDNYVDRDKADEILMSYIDDGYDVDDVCIDEVLGVTEGCG